jgi:hypothetical protein
MQQHPGSVPRSSVTDAVDATMLAQQGPGYQALSDLREADACAEQLGASDDPMRRAGDARELSLYRPVLLLHCNS